MIRFIFFLFGSILSIIGMIYIISYLNLLSLGYNFIEYVKFICSRPECIVGLIGILIIFLTIFLQKGE